MIFIWLEGHLMSTNNLAKTTFETGPDTKLATPDVYNEAKTTPQNNLPATLLLKVLRWQITINPSVIKVQLYPML